MPGLITHLLCSHHVMGQLDESLQQSIKKYPSSYYLGSQGPDIFFYYLPAFLNKETLNLGLLLHKNNTQDYILSLLDYAKKLKGENRDIALSYIMGHITHYALDSVAHPYIYYNSGFKQKGNIFKSIRHSLYHRKLETKIDTVLLNNLTEDKPSDKSLWEFFELSEKETLVISTIISRALNYTYGRYVSQKKTASILKYVLLSTKYLQTPAGRKRKVLEFLDDLTIYDEMKNSLIKDQGDIDILNLNEDFWHVPWDKELKKHSTFVELYNNGLKSSTLYANTANMYVDDKISSKYLRKTIKNLSMASGKDCEEELDWQHFSVIFNR